MKSLKEFVKEGYSDKAVTWEKIGDCLNFAENLGIDIKKEDIKVFTALVSVYGIDALEKLYKQDWSDVEDEEDKIIMGSREMLNHYKK